MVVMCLATAPGRSPLLGERPGAFLGVVGAEHARNDGLLHRPELFFGDALRGADEALRGGDGQRSVAGDPLGEGEGDLDGLAWFGEATDESVPVGVLGGD